MESHSKFSNFDKWEQEQRVFIRAVNGGIAISPVRPSQPRSFWEGLARKIVFSEDGFIHDKIKSDDMDKEKLIKLLTDDFVVIMSE